jgi:hypothetical protein
MLLERIECIEAQENQKERESMRDRLNLQLERLRGESLSFL